MSKDAPNEDLDLTSEEKSAFKVLVKMMAKHQYGERPPKNTTFAEIEAYGHQVGRMVARAVDVELSQQHAEHYEEEQVCPACQEKSPTKESPHDLKLQTRDGFVKLPETACHCSRCRRDFFPSAY